MFLAPWSRSPLKKNRSRSRSRLEKKSGAGAAKELAGSSALREDKKQREIILSLRGKEYFAKEPEPGVFGPLEPEPLEKKNAGAGAA